MLLACYNLYLVQEQQTTNRTTQVGQFRDGMFDEDHNPAEGLVVLMMRKGALKHATRDGDRDVDMNKNSGRS